MRYVLFAVTIFQRVESEIFLKGTQGFEWLDKLNLFESLLLNNWFTILIEYSRAQSEFLLLHHFALQTIKMKFYELNLHSGRSVHIDDVVLNHQGIEI